MPAIKFYDFVQQSTASEKLLPLRRDAWKCHCSHGAHVHTQQEGPVSSFWSDLVRDDLSASRLDLFTSTPFDCPFLSSCSISYFFFFFLLLSLFHCLLLLLSCTRFSYILTSHSALLCPCYHDYCLLQMSWGGRRNRWRIHGPRIPVIIVSLSFQSLSLCSLQLSTVRRKSCKTTMSPCQSFCPSGLILLCLLFHFIIAVYFMWDQTHSRIVLRCDLRL